ncbi:hypothetical protein ACFFOM_12335 [Microlunatus capsulatus]|uniref:Uncharacterized protein n=1 Tax=Microlunatus capsulatus TaxID=99117 RepID=A0ABS4Z8U1_9ACTN|nr:hypothetical protein [Microlunatus capsulatus]MBP2417468.1 hypothetical protein [Microlunatus capsulatus]
MTVSTEVSSAQVLVDDHAPPPPATGEWGLLLVPVLMSAAMFVLVLLAG